MPDPSHTAGETPPYVPIDDTRAARPIHAHVGRMSGLKRSRSRRIPSPVERPGARRAYLADNDRAPQVLDMRAEGRAVRLVHQVLEMRSFKTVFGGFPWAPGSSRSGPRCGELAPAG